MYPRISGPWCAQRLRDQIRAWVVLPEVRDTESLQEARHSIETDMVRALKVIGFPSD